MTGFVDAGHNPTSLITIASLQDLGYTVNYNAADPYDGYDMDNDVPGCCNPPELDTARKLLRKLKKNDISWNKRKKKKQHSKRN